MVNIVLGIVQKRRVNSMNYLNCKKCYMAVACDEEAVAITCSICSMIDVNISSTQSEDCVEDALQYYQDYHVDAIQRTFLKHQVTSDDVTNEYITISDTITGIVKVFPTGGTDVSSNSMFDLKYQLSQIFVANHAYLFYGRWSYLLYTLGIHLYAKTYHHNR